MINDIETKQEKSIEAIAKAYNTTECSLLASDIRINSKSEKPLPINLQRLQPHSWGLFAELPRRGLISTISHK